MTDQLSLTTAQFANLFDHTLLKPDAQEADFRRLCREADQYGFAMVAINAANVPLCRELLAGTAVRTGAAISFPLGQCSLKTKLFETEDAIRAGAQEIDYVVNIGRVKAGDTAYLEEEMRGIVDLCRSAGVISKVIFENCYLTDAEKQTLCAIARAVEPNFVKTSTGFGPGGATAADVALMKAGVGERVKVKAAGGIRTLEAAAAMVRAGAERIGSSSGIAIVEELKRLRGEA